MKQGFRRIVATFSAFMLLVPSVPVSAAESVLPHGWLLWHCYSDYGALDSRLYLRNPDGEITEIIGDFIHPMNGSFGTSPDHITFMAIDRAADEWDVFLYDNGTVTNLTQNSGFRNEDPKWSPDGSSIVFKRGHWEQTADAFLYDLALLDLPTGEITMLTNDSTEEAMPCFSEDGLSLYYAGYTDRIGAIFRMDLTTGITEPIYQDTAINAYYPVVHKNDLYFTRWHSIDKHTDQIVRYDGQAITSFAFNSPDFDCSDACPLDGYGMIYSSTRNDGYDLYYFDGTSSAPLSELNTDKNELGADFYSWAEYEAHSKVLGDVDGNGIFNVSDVVHFQKWLLAIPGTELPDADAADCDENGCLDIFDLGLLKRALLHNTNFMSKR